MRNIAVVFFASISALLVVWMGVQYCQKIVRGQAHPTITTWIIFELGVVMSLVTYFSAREHSVVKNVTNASDCVMVSAILITLFVKRWGEKLRFSRNEHVCLAISAVAFVAWAISRDPIIGNIGFQVVMVVAYGPLVERLWLWKKIRSPEPFSNWAASALAGFFGFCAAFAGRDGLAMLYPARSALFCIFVLFLIKRIEARSA